MAFLAMLSIVQGSVVWAGLVRGGGKRRGIVQGSVVWAGLVGETGEKGGIVQGSVVCVGRVRGQLQKQALYKTPATSVVCIEATADP